MEEGSVGSDLMTTVSRELEKEYEDRVRAALAQLRYPS